MNRNILDDIISEVGAAFGVAGLKLNADGTLGLKVDDNVVGLRISMSDESLLLYADLGPLPASERPEQQLMRLMKASLFGRATGGGALSLAADGNPDHPMRVVLWRRVETAGLTSQRLRDRLGMMLDTATDLRDGLADTVENAVSGATGAQFGTRTTFVPPLGGMA